MKLEQMQEDHLSARDWEAMRKGDQKAFERIYQDHFKILYNYGRKLCSNTALVEDAIHDLFVDLWRFRENLSPTTSVRFYLYRSLRRKIVKSDLKFEWASEDALLTDSSLFSPSQENEIIESEVQDERHHRLQKLISNLSPRQYEALILFFYDEFSYDEIAAIMDLNAQSARNLVQRGLGQLRQYAKHFISIGLLCMVMFF